MSFPKLAYAAYAAGLLIKPEDYTTDAGSHLRVNWNPLVNDYEAFYLLTTLEISVSHKMGSVVACISDGRSHEIKLMQGVLVLTRAEATRRAITNCAINAGELKHSIAVIQADREKELEAAIAFRDAALKGSTTVEVPAKGTFVPLIKWQILTVHGTYVTVQSDKDPTEVDGYLEFHIANRLQARFRNYDHIERQN